MNIVSKKKKLQRKKFIEKRKYLTKNKKAGKDICKILDDLMILDNIKIVASFISINTEISTFFYHTIRNSELDKPLMMGFAYLGIRHIGNSDYDAIVHFGTKTTSF